MKTYHLYIYFFWVAFPLRAQIELEIADAENREGIPSVYVFIEDAEKNTYNAVSDPEGKIILTSTMVFPVQASFHHVKYATVQKEINSQQIRTILLQPLLYQLDQIVITGQPRPQSSKNSLYTIQTLDQEFIQSQGASQLQDVIRNLLNIQISKDLATGASSMQLQGLGGQNIKVLVDGVPLIGRLGESIDLEQINTYNIEKIEILEGSMAVDYGTNALAGVINIITQKESPYIWDIQLLAQEESVGTQYTLKEGIHNQDLQINYAPSKKWKTQVHLGRNYFGGFQGIAEGRSEEWSPKKQYLADAKLDYQTPVHKIGYKLSYFNEEIEVRGQAKTDFTAVDELYTVNRRIHQLYTTHFIKNLFDLQTLGSFSHYTREKRRFIKDLTTLSETLTTGEGDQDTTQFQTCNFRGKVNNFHPLKKSPLYIELGYEINLEKAGGGRLDQDDRSLQDMALFASSELTISPGFKLKTGLRPAHNSLFDVPLIPSVHLKYSLTSNTTLRASYGKGFRSPSLRDLYFKFVDSNHSLYGNDALQPEIAHNYIINLKQRFSLSPKNLLETTISGFYNKMKNLITLAEEFVSETGRLSFRYTNLSRFETLGMRWVNTWVYNRLKIETGISYTGRYNLYFEGNSSAKKFLYSPEFNLMAHYKVPHWKNSLALTYKYTGQRNRYALDEEGELYLAETQGFHWLNLTFNQTLFKNLNAIMGVKNLMNVQKINSTGVGDVHGGQNQVPVSYGRSYFLRLAYRFHNASSAK